MDADRPDVVPSIEYPRCDLKALADLIIGTDKKASREVCVYVDEGTRVLLLANLVTGLRKFRKNRDVRYLASNGREASYQVPQKDGDPDGGNVAAVEWGLLTIRLGKSEKDLTVRGGHDRAEFFVHDACLATASSKKRTFLQEQHLSCFRVVTFALCRPSEQVSNRWDLRVYERKNWGKLRKKLKAAKLIKVQNCAWFCIILLSVTFVFVAAFVPR